MGVRVGFVMALVVAVLACACGRSELRLGRGPVGGSGGTGTTSVTTSSGTTSVTTSSNTTTSGSGGGPALCAGVLEGPYYAMAPDFAMRLAVGDLDEDGIDDLVVGGGPGWTVLISNGDGSFEHTVHTIADDAFSVALGDLNDDSHLDLAAADGERLHVYFGDGHGALSFFSEGVYDPPIGNSSLGIGIGQLDDDDWLDVVVADLSDELFLLPGIGGGASGPIAVVPVGEAPQALDLADLDGDGIDEIAVVSYQDDDLWLLWSGGSIDSYTSSVHPVGGLPREPAFEDLDGDGRLDLVVATESVGASVLLRTGPTSFAPAVSYETGSRGQGVATGDVTGDGIVDVVIADDDLSILPGMGDGTFGAPERCEIVGVPRDVVVGDFDDDGRLDVALTRLSGGDQGVQIFLGRPH